MRLTVSGSDAFIRFPRDDIRYQMSRAIRDYLKRGLPLPRALALANKVFGPSETVFSEVEDGWERLPSIVLNTVDVRITPDPKWPAKVPEE